MSGTATPLGQPRGVWRGLARLYRLDPPMQTEDYGSVGHVIVSAVNAMPSGPETFIFPATPDGKAIAMAELPGSYIGGMDHQAALRMSDYELSD